jgi:hypothetical protein
VKPLARSKDKKRETAVSERGAPVGNPYVQIQEQSKRYEGGTMNVLGLDGTEITATAKYNTFCNLCRKKICKGETVRTWLGHSFIVHQDCGLAEGRISNGEFREYAKVRKYNRRKKETGSLRSPTPSLRSVVMTQEKDEHSLLVDAIRAKRGCRGCAH